MAAEFRRFLPGDPAPAFRTGPGAPGFGLDGVAGRYVLLAFIGGAADPAGKAQVEALESLSDLFDDEKLTGVLVSLDHRDEEEGRIRPKPPGLRVLWDFDRSVSQLFGAAPTVDQVTDHTPFQRIWYLVDPSFRVLAAMAPPPDAAALQKVRRYLQSLPAPALHAGAPLHAPVLVVPRVFEPDLCAALIARSEAADTGDGPAMVPDAAGRTRRDRAIDDPDLLARARERVARRVTPELEKAFQFRATRVERDAVTSFEAGDDGAAPHRQNTTMNTAHRRFAVAINLNHDYEGGEDSFPEFGPAGYRPPQGAALVYSASLLHQVAPITRGRRFAYLPFLYDDAAAELRDDNRPTPPP